MYKLTEKDKILLLCAFEQDGYEFKCESCIVDSPNECGENYKEASDILLVKLGVK